MSKPVLWIVIPCYNEEQVLPITAPMFLQKITSLTEKGMISDKSRVLFVNDGSRDKTWELICSFAKQDAHFIGISQSRNRGHQNAVLAGLMEARANNCDITISIDCDGQDDINAMDEMVQKYLDGAEVVYGVRSRRDTDTFFKRFTAEGFYHLMNALGADIVFNHADYRLISARVLDNFADYKEVNIFLRGMVPLVGFKSEQVFYERHERLAGESHYPLRKMLALAFDGITSLSNKPIRIITGAGIVKARVVYGEKGIEDLSYSPYAVRHVHSLALMQADTIDYTYKSAGREPLNCLFALRGACDDILIVKQGLLTDTSIANIALSDGTHWYTPAHPLLKGTKRAALLEEGILQEKDIRPEDLPSFSTVRLFNAMIDWGELELPVRNIIP